MNPLTLVLLAGLLVALSGLPALLDGRPGSRRLSAGLALLAGGLGLVGVGGSLAGAAPLGLRLDWPTLGDPSLGLDALSAFFLAPVFLVGGLGALYGLGYARESAGREPAPLYWGLLLAGMILLLVARHAAAFLLGWELMALAAFFLVSTHHELPETRHASWLYLAATHVATLALLALFAIWQASLGTLELRPVVAGGIGPGAALAVFLLALLAFGIKAGLAPLQVWLPPAHAAAPTHVSAILSGVVLKMGIYGLLRFLSLLPAPPPAWGGLVLLLGVISGLLGVIQALGQHDLKRLLAWHSVENIGIILLGLGLALLGRSGGHPLLVTLGLGGCLLHVWNHALFKALLFLGAGAVLRQTGTRNLDRLGGLARRMPWTAALFLIGAVAICGLPPLNGLVSELLIFLGLLQGAASSVGSAATALAVPALALIGALALACFIKVFGAVFLGQARTPAAEGATEVPWSMRLPMLVLAGGCLTIGLAPALVAPLLDRTIDAWLPAAPLLSPPLAGVDALGALGVLQPLLALLAALLLAGLLRLASRPAAAPTWDCGYARPDARMQTSASGLARPLVLLSGGILRAQRQGREVQGTFPGPATLRTEVRDGVLDRLLLPALQRLSRRLNWFHRFQQGLSQTYVLYILIAVVLLLGTLLPVQDLAELWRMPAQPGGTP
ncbi:MAG: proton-conducting transporter membrane subunit [Candidatus Delongbacteria bacterium]